MTDPRKDLPTCDELLRVHQFLIGVASFFDRLDPDEHDNLDEGAREAYALAALVNPKRCGRL